MDVHVGSLLVQSEEVVVTHLSTALAGLVTLEASDPNARSLPPADEAEVPPSHAFDIVPVDIPSSSNVSILPALGLPLFLSNLQVNQLSLFTVHAGKLAFLLIFSQSQDVLGSVSAQLKSCGAPVPNQVSSLMQWNPLLQKQIDDLKASNIG
jgi:hypothetical protein